VKGRAIAVAGWFTKPSAATTGVGIITAVRLANERTSRLAGLLKLDNAEPMREVRHVNASDAVSASSRSEMMRNSVRVLADRKLIASALRLMNCHFKMTSCYP
jgi:hypothetical protein